MASPEGARLAQTIRQKVEEMGRLCEGLDEATASRGPADRWSPKMILSHLCGPEGIGLVPAIQAILQQDTPRIDIEAADPYYTGNRARLTLPELLAEFKGEYGRMADQVAQLSEEQLARKAHIPLFKELPMGEYPTLAMFVSALAEYHMDDHINHMREILQALGVTSRPK